MDDYPSEISNDVLFQKIIQFLNLNKLNPLEYNISQVGFLTAIDLMNVNKNISNNNLYHVCNSLPDKGPGYIPSGDLINSYSLFLDYLSPINLSIEQHSNYRNTIKRKHQIINEIKKHHVKASVKKANNEAKTSGNKRVFKIMVTDLASKLNELHKIENKITKILLSGNDNITSNTASDNYELYQLVSAVSFETGARKLTGLNVYNMEVNKDQSENDHTYSAKYKIENLHESYVDWLKLSKENKFPITLQASGFTNVAKFVLKLKDALRMKSEHINVSSILKSTRKDSLKSGKITSLGKYNIKIELSGLKEFKVDPAKWFNTDIIKNKKYKLIDSAPDFFGNLGSIGFIPTSLILAFNFNLEIKLSAKDFIRINKSIENDKGFGLKIGHFHFITSGSKLNSLMTSNSEKSILNIKSTNDHLPYLVGVVSRNVSQFRKGNNTWK